MSKSGIVLEALRQKAEESGDWRHVYLDNARPDWMTDKTFRSCLSALSKRGVYKPVDDRYWGSVRMSDPK